MVGSRHPDDGEQVHRENVRRLDATWSAAKAELSRLREEVRRLSELGKAQEDLAKVQSEQEVALARLGEQVFRMVESRELLPPEALRLALADVKAKVGALARQQKEVAAVEGEAGAKRDKK